MSRFGHFQRRMTLDAAPGGGFQFRRWFGIILCALSYLFGYFHRLAASVLADMMADDFNVAKAQLGVFSSLFFWPYGLMQPFVGAISDVVDAGLIMGVSGIVAAGGSLVIGLSGTIVVACVGRVLLGFSCAFFFVTSTKVASNWFTASQFRLFSGALIGVGGIGSLLSQTPLSLLGHAIGWRVCMVGVSGASVVIGLLCFAFVRTTPHPHRGPSGKDIFRQLGRNIVKIVNIGDFWLLELCMFAGPGAYMDLSAMWAVPFVEDVCGVSADLASVIAMSLSIAATIGAPIMPIVAEKVGARKSTMIVALSIGTLCCLVMTLFGHMFNMWVVAAFYFLICIGTYVPQGVALPMFKEYGDAAMTGTLVGAGNAGPFIGSAVLQIVSSMLFESFGTHKHYPFRAYQLGLWALLTLFAFVATYALFFVTEKPPEEAEKAAFIEYQSIQE